MQRTALSKQRNKHLQTTLIEAAEIAPRYSPTTALLNDREKQRGNANRVMLSTLSLIGFETGGRTHACERLYLRHNVMCPLSLTSVRSWTDACASFSRALSKLGVLP